MLDKNTASANKRIANNTLLLYFRMLLMMVVSLYTSRVILESLGISDFGIYNVVGGIVFFLGFLNGTMSSASARFINVALVDKHGDSVQKTFSSLFWITFLLSLIILLFGETIGLWFVLEKVQYPLERKTAVFWVYQISILTIMINVISIPYTSMVIAYEKMKAFAYISLVDSFLKLGIAFLVGINFGIDKLIFYAFLIAALQIFNRALYSNYCKRSFADSKISFYFDKKLFGQIFSYLGWSSYGSFVSVGFTQGINILLNLFFGPAVNAARGVANQVSHACISFATNFQTAVNPQLTQSVAIGDFVRARFLLSTSSRFSFYLLCCLTVPIVGEADYVLSIWLKIVPHHACSFVQIMLIVSVLQTLAFSLRTVNQAEGNIRKFQLYECSLLMMIVPLSYLVLKYGYPPESVFIVHLIIESISQFVRILIVAPKIEMSIMSYFTNIYLRSTFILFSALIVTFLVKSWLPISFFRFVVNVFVTEFFLLASIFSYGINQRERFFFIEFLKKRLKSG